MPVLYNKKHLLKYQRKLRNNPTKSELIFWSKIRNNQLKVRFRRQYGIGPYIIDFYCPEAKLAVEIDGLTHSDEKVFDNDVKRQKYLENIGLKVKRYNSSDVLKNTESVITDLYHFIHS